MMPGRLEMAWTCLIWTCLIAAVMWSMPVWALLLATGALPAHQLTVHSGQLASAVFILAHSAAIMCLGPLLALLWTAPLCLALARWLGNKNWREARAAAAHGPAPVLAPPENPLTVQLVEAAKAGDESGVAAALAAGADPNGALAASGHMPLHAACASGRRGDLACVRRLLAAGADPNRDAAEAEAYEFSTGRPLAIAVGVGDQPELAAALMAAGADFRADQLEAVCVACSWGHNACATMFVEAGADPNARGWDEDGNSSTIFEEACARCSAEVVTRMLQAGADPAAVSLFGGTPLSSAIHGRNLGAVRALLAAAPHLGLQRCAAGRLPLHLAVSCNEFDVARLLLEHAQLPPAGEALAALAVGGSGELVNTPVPPSLYALLVARQPLTPAEWARVPAPCRGLGAALPAVLRRSEAEAAQLLRRLPMSTRKRLYTGAMCLKRCEQRRGVQLPLEIMRALLLAVADSE